MSTESAVYEIKLKDAFTSPLAAAENKMNRFEGRVNGLQGSFNGLGGSIAGAFAGGAVVSAASSLIGYLRSIGTDVVDTAAKFDGLKRSIEFASGENGAKNIKFLDNEINRLGLDMNSAYKGFKVFQGALMGTALEGAAGKEIFTALSEASTVMRLSAEDTEGAFLALGQMISKGSVQAEELRGQLGERLPGAFQQFARSLNVSTKELGEMLKAGDVLAVQALPLFAKQLRETFTPGLAEATESYNANLNRFNNFILRAKISLGSGLLPVLNQYLQVIPKLDFSPITHTLRQFKSEFSELFNLLGLSISPFESLTLALRGIAWSLRAVTSPLRFLLEGYSQFIMAVKSSWSVLKNLKDLMQGIFTGDFVQAAQGVEGLKTSFTNYLKDSARSAAEFGKREREGWAKIFSPISQDDEKSISASPGWNPFGGAFDKISGVSGSGTTQKSKAGEAGVEKIHSGTRNITVNITKLIETIKFEKYNGQSEAQLMEMIKRALVTTVNDVNIVAQ